MQKNDYMKLSKDRLAELLEERDRQDYLLHFSNFKEDYNVPCFAPNGICTNPHRDCINCPKDWGCMTITTHDNTAGFKCHQSHYNDCVEETLSNGID